MGGCMGQWVGSGQMTNLIKLELINIIWFCLKIYNLSRHPYLWVDGWVNGWAHVKPLKSNKFWPNWDNSIMDILDILLDILLKPPQPFIGLFCRFAKRGEISVWRFRNTCPLHHLMTHQNHRCLKDCIFYNRLKKRYTDIERKKYQNENIPVGCVPPAFCGSWGGGGGLEYLWSHVLSRGGYTLSLPLLYILPTPETTWDRGVKTSENITFPQLRWRAVTSFIQSKFTSFAKNFKTSSVYFHRTLLVIRGILVIKKQSASRVCGCYGHAMVVRGYDRYEIFPSWLYPEAIFLFRVAQY